MNATVLNTRSVYLSCGGYCFGRDGYCDKAFKQQGWRCQFRHRVLPRKVETRDHVTTFEIALVHIAKHLPIILSLKVANFELMALEWGLSPKIVAEAWFRLGKWFVQEQVGTMYNPKLARVVQHTTVD